MRAPYISFPRGWGKRGLLGCVGVYGRGYCTVDGNHFGACSCSSLLVEIERDGASFDWWDISCPVAIMADDDATVDGYEV